MFTVSTGSMTPRHSFPFAEDVSSTYETPAYVEYNAKIYQRMMQLDQHCRRFSLDKKHHSCYLHQHHQRVSPKGGLTAKLLFLETSCASAAELLVRAVVIVLAPWSGRLSGAFADLQAGHMYARYSGGERQRQYLLEIRLCRCRHTPDAEFTVNWNEWNWGTQATGPSAEHIAREKGMDCARMRRRNAEYSHFIPASDTTLHRP